MNELSLEFIHRHWSYDPVNGGIVWKEPLSAKCHITIGAQAGHGVRHGARVVRALGKYHCVHRIVWAIHYGVFPGEIIDHINCDPSDNRIENLRLATLSQNGANRRRHKNSKSPYKGICFVNGRWVARIRVDGKRYHLGYFATPEEAHSAYISEAEKRFGPFARAA